MAAHDASLRPVYCALLANGEMNGHLCDRRLDGGASEAAKLPCGSHDDFPCGQPARAASKPDGPGPRHRPAGPTLPVAERPSVGGRRSGPAPLRVAPSAPARPFHRTFAHEQPPLAFDGRCASLARLGSSALSLRHADPTGVICGVRLGFRKSWCLVAASCNPT
jgi:hypothetical protein